MRNLREYSSVSRVLGEQPILEQGEKAKTLQDPPLSVFRTTVVGSKL